MYCSDYVSSIAEAWNVVRTEILQEAVTDGLIPAAQHWARNLIIEEEEEFISDQCYKKLGDVRFPPRLVSLLGHALTLTSSVFSVSTPPPTCATTRR